MWGPRTLNADDDDDDYGYLRRLLIIWGLRICNAAVDDCLSCGLWVVQFCPRGITHCLGPGVAMTSCYYFMRFGQLSVKCIFGLPVSGFVNVLVQSPHCPAITISIF